MGKAQSRQGNTTQELRDHLEIQMKAMRMEFKLAILQLVMAIRDRNDRVLSDLVLDYATRLYQEIEFTGAE